MKKSGIKFVKGEPFCRYKGVIMSPENMIEMFGTDFEIGDEEFILWPDDGVLYTDKTFKEIIFYISCEVTDHLGEYDPVLDEGRGAVAHHIRSEYQDSYIIPKSAVDGITEIRPLRRFKKDHPEVKLKKLLRFSKCLNDYYENKEYDLE